MADELTASPDTSESPLLESPVAMPGTPEGDELLKREKAELEKKRKDREQEFYQLGVDIRSSRDALSKGRVPEFESPEDVVRFAAQKNNQSEEDYVSGMLKDGYDVRELVDVVGRQAPRGITEVLGVDLDDYFDEAKAKRSEISQRYAKKQVISPILAESQDRIADALSAKKEAGVELPQEAEDLLRKRLRGTEGYDIDAATNFVTTANIDKTITDADDDGLLKVYGIGSEVVGGGLGITNEGLLSSKERSELLGAGAAAKIIKPLTEDEDIAALVERYENDETGGMQWINGRLSLMADRLNLPQDSIEREQFVVNPRNRDRAIAELAGLKMAGLWQGPLLLPRSYFEGTAATGDGGFLEEAAKAALTPTVEVIGLARGAGAKDRVVFRSASTMRHVFDVMDGLQQVGAAGFRVLDKDLAESRRTGRSFFAPSTDERNERLKAQFINSLSTRDDFYKAMTESEFARSSPEARNLATGFGFVLALASPDLLGTVSSISSGARSIKGRARAQRLVDYLGEYEAAATDLNRIDALETALAQFERTSGVAEAARRANVEGINKIYVMSPADNKPAILGKEADAVTELLPNGDFSSPETADAPAGKLVDMRRRKPHTPSGVRRGQAGLGEGLGVKANFPELYSLGTRRAEFDTLEKVIDSGDERILFPHFRNKFTIDVDVSAPDGTVTTKTVPLADEFTALLDRVAPGLTKKLGLQFTENAGEVLQNPAVFRQKIINELNARGVALTPEIQDMLQKYEFAALSYRTNDLAEGRAALKKAVAEGRRAIDTQHEVRLFTASVLRQKIAAEAPKLPLLPDVKAPVRSPRLGALASKLPDLSPTAVLYKKRLSDLGVDDNQAKSLALFYDLQARKWARENGGRSLKEWWDINIAPPEAADAPPAAAAPPTTPPAPPAPPAPATPATPTTAAPTAPTAPTAPAVLGAPPAAAAPSPTAAPGVPPASVVPGAPVVGGAPALTEDPFDVPPGTFTPLDSDKFDLSKVKVTDGPTINPEADVGASLLLSADGYGMTTGDIAALDMFGSGLWKKNPDAKQSYGVVLVDDAGRILLRKPSGNFGGYHWTYAKGTPEPGETPFQTALREMTEETGFTKDQVTIVGALPKGFSSNPKSETFFWVARVKSPAKLPTDYETAAIIWASPETAQTKITQTVVLGKNAGGSNRDSQILQSTLNLIDHYVEVNPAVDETKLPLDFTSPEKSEAFMGEFANKLDDITYGPIPDPKPSPSTFDPTPDNPSVDNILITPESPGPALIEYDYDESLFEKVAEKPGGASSAGYIGIKKDDGTKWLIKEGGIDAVDKSAHARNEVLAANLYQALIGSEYAANTRLVKGKNGRALVASQIDPEVLEIGSQPVTAVAAKMLPDERIASLFADAILGIWDTIPGNIFMRPKNGFIRVDFGGALNYRAQGKLKFPGTFGAEVTELDTLRSDQYPAGKFYGDITNDDIAEYVSKYPLDEETRQFYKKLFADIVGKYGTTKSEAARQETLNILLGRLESVFQWTADNATVKTPGAANTPIKPAPAGAAASPKPSAPPVLLESFVAGSEVTVPPRVINSAELVKAAEAKGDDFVGIGELRQQVKAAGIQRSGGFPDEKTEDLVDGSTMTLAKNNDFHDELIADLMVLSMDDVKGNVFQLANKFAGYFPPSVKEEFDQVPHKASAVARHLASNGRSEMTRLLAAGLAPILEKHDAIFVATSKKLNFNKGLGSGNSYSTVGAKRERGVVKVDLDATSEAIVMHELIHAATLGAMSEAVDYENALQSGNTVKLATLKAENPGIEKLHDAYKDLRQLTLDIRKEATKDWTKYSKKVKAYADKNGITLTSKNRSAVASAVLSSSEYEDYAAAQFLRSHTVLGSANDLSRVKPEELITYVLTGNQVRKYLEKKKVTSDGRIISAFKAFIDKVIELLGVNPSPTNQTLFSAAVRSSTDFLDAVDLRYLRDPSGSSAASAGASIGAEVPPATLAWNNLGVESPYFKKWQEGLPLRSLPTDTASITGTAPNNFHLPGVYEMVHGTGQGFGKVKGSKPGVIGGSYIGFSPGKNKPNVPEKVFFVDSKYIGSTYSKTSKELTKDELTKAFKSTKASAKTPPGLLRAYVKTKMPLVSTGRNETYSRIPHAYEVSSLERNQPFMRGYRDYVKFRERGDSSEQAFNQAFRTNAEKARYTTYLGNAVSAEADAQKLVEVLYFRDIRTTDPSPGSRVVLIVPDNRKEVSKYGGTFLKLDPSFDFTSTDRMGRAAAVLGFDATMIRGVKDDAGGAGPASNIMMVHYPDSGMIKAVENEGTFDLVPDLYKALEEPASLAGAEPGDEIAALQDYAENGVNATRFRAWFGDSYTPDGTPELLYHGTSQDFDSFIQGRESGAFGSAQYFTTSLDDANVNYADIDGADIQNKIDMVAESLELDDLSRRDLIQGMEQILDSGRDLDDDAIAKLNNAIEGLQSAEAGSPPDDLSDIEDFVFYDIADDLTQTIAAIQVTNNFKFSVMPVYAKIDKPVIIDVTGDRPMTMFDESVMGAIENAVFTSEGYEDIAIAVSEVLADEGRISAKDLYDIVMEKGSYYAEETGSLANGELFRLIAQFNGYDGIVAHAYDLFGPKPSPLRGMLPGMAEVNPGVYHYHTFEGRQLKSAFNQGTFSATDTRVLRATVPPATPTPPPALPSPEVILLEDGRTLLRGFENATVNDMVAAVSSVLRRGLDPIKQDELLRFVNESLGTTLTRRGGVFEGDPADLAKADDLINNLLVKYLKDGELPVGAEGLTELFDDMKADLVTGYRVASVSAFPISADMKDLFDPLLRQATADENPLKSITELAFKALVTPEKSPTEPLGDFFGALSRELSRQGTSLSREEITDAVEEAIQNFEDSPSAVVITSDAPLFPQFGVPEANADGKFEYRLVELKDLQESWEDGLSAKIAERVDPYSIFGQKNLSEIERFYKRAEKPVDPAALESAKQRLTALFGERFASRYISRTDVKLGVITTFLAGIRRKAIGAILGGDENLDISMLPVTMQRYIKRGIREVEQATGDGIRLVTDLSQAKKGAAKDEARNRLYSYLSGEVTEFFFGGRVAATSGTQKFMDLSSEARTYFEDATFKHKGETYEALTLLQHYANMVDPKVTATGVISPGPGGAFSTGTPATALDRAASAYVKELFAGNSDTGGLQFFRDVHASILSAKDSGIGLPQSRQVIESVLYNLGITTRNKMHVLGDADGPGTNSRARVQLFLEEIENASLAAKPNEATGKGAASFGAHTRESSFARMAVLIAGHGTATRTRQVWSEQGIYIPKSTFDAFSDWSNGKAVSPEMMPEVQRTAEIFGLNPQFFADEALDVNYFVPRAARARLTDALARTVVRAEDNELFTGGFFQALKASESELQGAVSVYYRFLKISLVRGNYLLKQRYFFMNTYDHFMQTAQIVGFREALVSTSRLAVINAQVFPGIAPLLALGRRFDPQFPEKFRRFLQVGGDATARAIGTVIGASKWRVDVNAVLDGRDGFVRLGGNLYSYRQLRDIAVQEGLFASFDTSALRKSISQAHEEMFGKGRVRSFMRNLDWYRDHVTDMAEAWSERERIGLFVTLIESGVNPRSAGQTAIDVLFDYAGTMSEADRKVWVGVFFPFWAFQKNANRQLIQTIFTPGAVYRMGILRRGRELIPEIVTEMLYEQITDEYGINEGLMTEEQRQAYAMTKRQIEYGYGPIELMEPSTRVVLEATFGPLEDLDDETLEFIENGYSRGELSSEARQQLSDMSLEVYYYLKYGTGELSPSGQAELDALLPETREFVEKPVQVPARVRQQIRLLFATSTGETRTRIEDSGSQFDLDQPTIEAVKNDPIVEAARAAYIPKYDPAITRNYNRDKQRFAFTPRPTKQSYLYSKMQQAINPDYPFFEVFLPEASTEAAMRHTAGVVATVLLGGAALIDLGASTLGVKETGFAGDVWARSLRESGRQVVDVERAPLVQNIVRPVLSEERGVPTRVHPLIGSIMELGMGPTLLKVDGKHDLLNAVKTGLLTEDEADRLLSDHQRRIKESPEAEGIFGLPEVVNPLVDEKDARVTALSNAYEGVDPALLQRVVDVSDKLEMEPGLLAQVIQGESGFNSKIYNLQGQKEGEPKSKLAVGLIQFVPRTARSLGTTTAELEAMTPIEQMEFVYKYLEPFKGRLNSYEDVAMAVFYPEALGKPDSFNIADDVYKRSLKSNKREIRKKNPEMSEAEVKAAAEARAKAARAKMVRMNRGIELKGDYIERFQKKTTGVVVGTRPAADLSLYSPDVESDIVYENRILESLPLRAEKAQITGDRYYLFPGLAQLLFQTSGLYEINRMMLGELPLAQTPFEKAAVGDEYLLELPEIQVGNTTLMTGGVVPDPTATRAGMMIWARATLGLTVAETQRSKTARLDEPRTGGGRPSLDPNPR